MSDEQVRDRAGRADPTGAAGGRGCGRRRGGAGRLRHGDDDARDGGAARDRRSPDTGRRLAGPRRRPQALARTSDIPVGGGEIFADQGVVVTQPTAGEFKAFGPICTHQGCPVTNVDGGTINCTCHNSRFSIEDGSVKAGPATKPLPAKHDQGRPATTSSSPEPRGHRRGRPRAVAGIAAAMSEDAI